MRIPVKKFAVILTVFSLSDRVNANDNIFPTTGDVAFDAAIDSTLGATRNAVIGEITATALEEYGSGHIKKYGPIAVKNLIGSAKVVSGVGIGLNTFFTITALGIDSDILQGDPKFPEIEQVMLKNRNIALNERANKLGISAANLANDMRIDFSKVGATQVFEAKFRREILQAERKKSILEGKKYRPDYFTLREIESYDSLAEKRKVGPLFTKIEEVNLSIANETFTTPFRSLESQLHSSLAGQTTGLTSHIGDARSNQAARELERILATTPDGAFVATVEAPSGTATGSFSGDEGLNIAGVLNVFAFDSGSLQDGDRVRITVRDSQGVRLSRSFTLTFGGSTSRVSVRRGIVNVTITALNEGTSPPNTGGLRLSGDISGSRSRNFNLNRGSSGTLAVRVLGN